MEHEPRFTDWLERMTDPVAILEGVTIETMRARHWNQAFAALMGIRDASSANQDLAIALARAEPMDPARRLEARTDFERANKLALKQGRHLTRWQFLQTDNTLLQIEVELIALPSVGPEAFCAHIRDISEALETNESLQRTEARFRDLFEVASDACGFVSIMDDAPRFIECNTALCSLYGVQDKAQLLGRTPIDFALPVQPDGQPSTQRAQGVYEQTLRHGHARFEWLAKRLDGTEFWIDITLTLQPSWGEGAVHFSGRDITERKQAEATLARAEELARITLQSIGDGVITTDAQARVTGLNPVVEQLTGWSQAEAQNRPITEVFKIINEDTRTPADNPLLLCLAEERVVGLANHTALLSRNGSEYAIEDSAAPIRMPDGTLAGAIIVFHDVTGARRLAAEMSHQARHDPLTSLPNRREFETRLDELLEQARRTNSQHALCYVDLDQFKVVNDGCGHGAGDQLLAELATLLSQKIRRGDTLARLGGDEFGVLLADCPPQKAAEIAAELLGIIGDFRFRYGERSFNVGASIGLVPITATAASAAELLTEADLACYTAKDLGRNRVHLFRPGDADLARRRSEMQWATELRLAMDEKRLVLYVQPITALADASSKPWFEVLLRLRHHDGRIVLPGTFLPAAERFGLMPLIDRYVLDHALPLLLQPDAVGGARLSLNLSGSSLEDEAVMAIFENYFADPRRVDGKLCMELTEATAVACRRSPTSSTCRRTTSSSTAALCATSRANQSTVPWWRPSIAWPPSWASRPSPSSWRKPTPCNCSRTSASITDRAFCWVGRYRSKRLPEMLGLTSLDWQQPTCENISQRAGVLRPSASLARIVALARRASALVASPGQIAAQYARHASQWRGYCQGQTGDAKAALQMSAAYLHRIRARDSAREITTFRGVSAVLIQQ